MKNIFNFTTDLCTAQVPNNVKNFGSIIFVWVYFTLAIFALYLTLPSQADICGKPWEPTLIMPQMCNKQQF